MRYTYIKYALSVAIAVAALCSCSELAVELPFAGTEQTHDPAGEMVEIMLRVPSLATRTSIGSDDGKNLTPVWADGDSFGLYIENEAGKVDGPYKFTHRPNEHDKADNIFVGQLEKDLVSSMYENEEYTYHAVYPYSESFVVDGSSIGCSIAAVQSGRYGSDADIMYASAVGGKLSRTFFNDLGFEFRHLTHALKIHLPAGVFEGREVSGLGVNFPQPVSGDMKIDMASGKPQLSGTGNGVTVHFDEPTTGDCDIWVYIYPGNMSDGAVRFVVTDGTEYSFPLKSTWFGELEARHITPVSLGAMTLREQQDYTITVNPDQLGEPVTVLNSLTLPDGYMFPGLEMSPTITDVTSPTPGEFKIKMFKDVAEKLVSSGVTSLSMIMESDHAENLGAKGPCALSAVGTEGLTVKSPYLFFEDFSGVETFSSYDEYDSGFNSGSKDAVSFLDGWTGARIGAQAGTSIRIAARRETSANYAARVDSAPISTLKDGASVNVKVSFECGMNQKNGGLGGTDVNQTCYMGSVTSSEAFNSGSTTGDFTDQFTIKESTGSWTSVPNLKTYNVNGCTNVTRLSWRTMPQNKAGMNNNTLWLYLDNIRVSIVQ